MILELLLKSVSQQHKLIRINVDFGINSYEFVQLFYSEIRPRFVTEIVIKNVYIEA